MLHIKKIVKRLNNYYKNKMLLGCTILKNDYNNLFIIHLDENYNIYLYKSLEVVEQKVL
jgi:hypothetical protein